MSRTFCGAAILRILAAAALAWHPSTRAAEATVELTVVRADTLIGLSHRVLVSPVAWREVARLNHLPDPDLILPGQRLRVPVRLLRSEALSATLISVTGPHVTVRAGAAAVGTPVVEGDFLQTGPDSSAVLALPDGSRVQIAPSSLAEVAMSRHYGSRLPANAAARPTVPADADAPGAWFAGTLRMLHGSIEVFAIKVLRAKPLEVVTPTAVVGVRGTRYRVSIDGVDDLRTHAEVLEGMVRFEPASRADRGSTTSSDAADLRSGYGASLSRAGAPDARPPRGSEGGPAAPTATVAALLPAPDLGSLAGRFDRPVVRFTVAGVDTALRIQIAADPAFDQIVSDQRVAVGAEVRIAGLGDATWYLRARRIGAQGIEGLDTVRPLVLSARPEPPAYLRPRGYATQGVGDIDFAWAPNVDAPRTQIQVATDPGFEHIVIDRDALDAASLRAVLGTPGTYHWRLASVRPDGSHGPFGDPQTFTLRPAPPSPTASRSADGGLVFNWGSRPGVHYQVEFARDTAFADVVGRGEVDGSQWTSPPVAGGRYYFRYRSLEPDGFVTPFSETVQVDIPHDWSGVGVLVPVLLFLL